jgi:5-methylcytosine-specific restriction endonuclease McrA
MKYEVRKTPRMASRAYNGPWQKVRKQILERDAYRCQINGPGCTGHANEVDHIVPLRVGGSRLEPTNLRASCKHCNIVRSNALRTQLVDLALRGRDAAPPSRTW